MSKKAAEEAAREHITSMTAIAQELLVTLRKHKLYQRELTAPEMMVACAILVQFVIRVSWDEEQWPECVQRHASNLEKMLGGSPEWDASMRRMLQGH